MNRHAVTLAVPAPDWSLPSRDEAVHAAGAAFRRAPLLGPALLPISRVPAVLVSRAIGIALEREERRRRARRRRLLKRTLLGGALIGVAAVTASLARPHVTH
jgi:hypothetical protein